MAKTTLMQRIYKNLEYATRHLTRLTFHPFHPEVFNKGGQTLKEMDINRECEQLIRSKLAPQLIRTFVKMGIDIPSIYNDIVDSLEQPNRPTKFNLKDEIIIIESVQPQIEHLKE